MHLFLRFIQILYSLYGFVVFLLLMFLLFPLIVAASLLGKEKGGNIIYIICRFWSDACLFLWGIRHKNYFEEPHNQGKPSILVFNHNSYMDIPILMSTFRYQHIRVLGKVEMIKVPVFGFIYKNAVVTVDRSDAAHRAKSVQILKSVLKKNISVVIAPEGTFNLTHQPLKEFYDGAFKIAIETQTPIKPVLFLDAYDRLHHKSIFSLTPGKSRAIYLAEIPIKNFGPNDTAVLKKMVFDAMEAGLKKYKASWIK
jgi:1-acyl-sn-glycerol-3-phosphate acyltransferase